MRVDVLVLNLLAELESWGPEPDRLKMLESIQQWLQRFVRNWRPELRKLYGLDEYAALDLSPLPIDQASLVPKEILQQLRAVPPSSMDLFAMRLGEIFWDGITVESSITCPRCSSAQLKILEDPGTEDVVLSCDLCFWAQSSSGERWKKPDQRLRPASKELLNRWRSLGR